MVQKRKVILDAYKDKRASFLETPTLLKALEKKGFRLTKKALSNFIRNSLERSYLVPSRRTNGTIVGWTLVE